MRNKKIKLYASAVLGALSCLSSLQINTDENEKQNLLKEKVLNLDSTMINSDIKQNNQIISPITPTPGMHMQNRMFNFLDLYFIVKYHFDFIYLDSAIPIRY